MHRKYRKSFNSYSATIFVICAELIKSYLGLKHIIIDKEILNSETMMNGLESILDNMPEIDFILKGDKTFPIVNHANCIANKLSKHHTSLYKEAPKNQIYSKSGYS